MIHSSAQIHSSAEIDENVTVGPYTFIGPKVKISSGTVIEGNVFIHKNTFIGNDNLIYPFASIGGDPQDLKYKGEETYLEIGNKMKFVRDVRLIEVLFKKRGKPLLAVIIYLWLIPT